MCEGVTSRVLMPGAIDGPCMHGFVEARPSSWTWRNEEKGHTGGILERFSTISKLESNRDVTLKHVGGCLQYWSRKL